MRTLLEYSPDYKFSVVGIPRWYIVLDLLLVLGIAASFFTYATAYTAPENFPRGEIVTIESGMNLSDVTVLLEEKHVIKSPRLFSFFVRVLAGDNAVRAGDYFLTEELNTFEVARRITTGHFGLTPVWVTIPEGSSNSRIATILSRQFPLFDKDEFLLLAEDDQGYLFPDTYLFPRSVRAHEVIASMRANFEKRTADLEEKVKNSGRSMDEIVSMAALIEKEANKEKDRRLISGVLWYRLELGMLLQVDAVFPHIIGKNTYQVTLKDLRTNSPYNTYVYGGLPPGGITNPGLSAIMAALEPTPTEYLFYLADRRGNTYYAKTYPEHQANKRKYFYR